MQELIDQLKTKAGLTEEQAIKSVQTIKEYIQSKLPPMMHGVIDNFLGSTTSSSGEAKADAHSKTEEMKDKAKAMAEEAKEKMEDFADMAKEMAKDAGGKMEDMAEKARKMAKEAGEIAEDLAEDASKKLKDFFGGNKK